jgi:hypothetical protein
MRARSFPLPSWTAKRGEQKRAANLKVLMLHRRARQPAQRRVQQNVREESQPQRSDAQTQKRFSTYGGASRAILRWLPPQRQHPWRFQKISTS